MPGYGQLGWWWEGGENRPGQRVKVIWGALRDYTYRYPAKCEKAPRDMAAVALPPASSATAGETTFEKIYE